jgi:peptidoglycan/xylan/chitin deacetylase (PgdA/CDA1 family)
MTATMRADWSQLKARVSNRLARHFRAAPLRLPGNAPMVSFTFDDVPRSAATVGAPMLEEFGGRATFYVAGSLVSQWSGLWAGIGADEIIDLHRNGHEIACHTFSHRRATELDAAAMEAEIEQNRRYFHGLDASIRLENFAYPYGLASLLRKRQLGNTFRSSRGILPGVNSDLVDLHFLRATPLIDEDIDTSGVERAFDEAAACGGWLIFYGHDVAAEPSRYGCTPQLLRHALQAASRRNIPIVSVAEALRRAGA